MMGFIHFIYIGLHVKKPYIFFNYCYFLLLQYLQHYTREKKICDLYPIKHLSSQYYCY